VSCVSTCAVSRRSNTANDRRGGLRPLVTTFGSALATIDGAIVNVALGPTAVRHLGGVARARLSHLAVSRCVGRNGRLTSTGVGGRKGRERHIVGFDNLSPERKGHMSLSDPVLTGPLAGRTVTSGHGSTAELKLAGEESGGDWAVVEWRVRAGDDPPIHTHTREDETIYVLEGAITAFVGDERIEVEAGSYAALPKDVPHGLTVRGEEARLLVTLAPAGAEYFLVPRDENDADPARFGLIVQGPAMAA
jgi:quercetin dioxygenase-like cupin family protein